MLPTATRFGDLRLSTLSWCRRTRISACNAARERNSPAMAHQISPQRSSGPLSTDSNGDVSHFGFPVGTAQLRASPIPSSQRRDLGESAASFGLAPGLLCFPYDDLSRVIRSCLLDHDQTNRCPLEKRAGHPGRLPSVYSLARRATARPHRLSAEKRIVRDNRTFAAS